MGRWREIKLRPDLQEDTQSFDTLRQILPPTDGETEARAHVSYTPGHETDVGEQFFFFPMFLAGPAAYGGSHTRD